MASYCHLSAVLPGAAAEQCIWGTGPAGKCNREQQQITLWGQKWGGEVELRVTGGFQSASARYQGRCALKFSPRPYKKVGPELHRPFWLCPSHQHAL